MTSQLLQTQKTLKDVNTQKPINFFDANMCLTYDGIKSGSGLFAALDWEQLSCHGVRNFKILKGGQRVEAVGGRKSSSCVFPMQRLLRPADVPVIPFDVKERIWPTMKLSNTHNEKGTRGYMKEVDPRWRGQCSLVYGNRSTHHLEALINDLGPVSLIVDMTVGWGQSVMAAMISNSGNEKSPTIPVLCLANTAEHSTYVTGVLDEYVLRALKTPGHRLHEECLEQEISEAFPNLCCLTATSQDDTGNVDQSMDFDEADLDADAVDLVD